MWAQWTRNQVEAFENSTITDCQMFMNSAVLKYNQITSKDGKFVGSLSTVQEDIITMIATQSKPTFKRKSEDQQDNKISRVRKEQPPFIKDTHSTKNGKKMQHKIGDKKEWSKTTYYFCDCPNHLNSAHWHTHKTEECRSRNKWLKWKSSKEATLNKENEAYSATTSAPELQDSSTSPDSTNSNQSGPAVVESFQSIQALLATAFNMTQDNHAARDAIAEALNSLS